MHAATPCGVSLLPSFPATPPASRLPTELEAAVRPLLRKLSANNNDSAWSLAYKDADYEVALCAGPVKRSDNGSSARACSSDDTFAWGSITKPMTAVLLLQLAERGVLDLDAPVAPLVDPLLSHWAGSDANSSSLAALYGPNATAITSRQLLSHRSGLSEYDGRATRLYQNLHPGEDLDPLWVLRQARLMYAPGSAALGEYSSTGYTLAGLVATAALRLARWDVLDQAAALVRPGVPAGSFAATRFPVHGRCSAFETATRRTGHTSVHGYENPRATSGLGAVDTSGLSCTQGWTCGNAVSTPREVARFFWLLLGPPRALLSPASLRQMMTWQPTQFRPSPSKGNFSYGLGLMDFNSMDWGFQYNGSLLGHNGLTYGFGAQSGYNRDYRFSLSFVNNVEHWIGPDAGPGVPNELYEAVVAVVRRFRDARAGTVES